MEEKIVQAGFKDAKTGKVYPSGQMHNIDNLPDDLDIDIDNLESGFITDQNRFLNRQQAAELVKLKDKTKGLHTYNIRGSKLKKDPHTGKDIEKVDPEIIETTKKLKVFVCNWCKKQFKSEHGKFCPHCHRFQK